MDRRLERFVEAQDANGAYASAIAELRRGEKQTHWMWFVFPQLAGLGQSPTAQFYAIADRDEAQAYIAHPTLGSRLVECTTAVLEWAGRKNTQAIFGTIDAMKFRSSMTLFETVSDEDCFSGALREFYQGERDTVTLARL
jgi:uncharacterized protein (DUF1810 family)